MKGTEATAHAPRKGRIPDGLTSGSRGQRGVRGIGRKRRTDRAYVA